MKVEVWSDLTCPWCGLGQHRLAEALAAFEHADEVEVVHRSYELNPGAEPGVTVPVVQMLRERYGADQDRAVAMCRQAESAAAADGISPYIVAYNKTGNTAWAHQLLAYAAEQGVSDKAWGRLYAAYFGEGRSIFDIDSLVKLAGEIGLDDEAARDAIESGRYVERVREDQAEALRLGINGVPFFLIDGSRGVSGAPPVSIMLQALMDAWDLRAPQAR